jgi:hypothetical protein
MGNDPVGGMGISPYFVSMATSVHGGVHWGHQEKECRPVFAVIFQVKCTKEMKS